MVRFSSGLRELLVEFGGEVRTSALETLEVSCFVVRDAVAWAHENDSSLLLKGQSADGSGIGFAAGELSCVNTLAQLFETKVC